jgi:hypothetical protein
MTILALAARHQLKECAAICHSAAFLAAIAEENIICGAYP